MYGGINASTISGKKMKTSRIEKVSMGKILRLLKRVSSDNNLHGLLGKNKLLDRECVFWIKMHLFKSNEVLMIRCFNYWNPTGTLCILVTQNEKRVYIILKKQGWNKHECIECIKFH